MASESGEDWVLVLSDDEDSTEPAKDGSIQVSAVPDKTLTPSAQNTKESEPGTSAAEKDDDKSNASKTDSFGDDSKKAALQSDQKILTEESSDGSLKSEKPSVKECVGDSSTDNKLQAGHLQELNDEQKPEGDKKEDDAPDSGDESGDSEQTIVMDTCDIEKAVDKDDDKVAAKEIVGEKPEKENLGGTGGTSSEVSLDVGKQEKQQLQKVVPKADVKTTEVSEGGKPDAASVSGVEKDHEGARGTFRSLDLPIQPVHETRRSRVRQRSEEQPLERSPSVASNRSEESSGTGSSIKQRRKEGLSTEAMERERRKSGASSSTKGGVKMVRQGFEFKAGFRLQAQDFSDKW